MAHGRGSSYGTAECCARTGPKSLGHAGRAEAPVTLNRAARLNISCLPLPLRFSGYFSTSSCAHQETTPQKTSAPCDSSRNVFKPESQTERRLLFH